MHSFDHPRTVTSRQPREQGLVSCLLEATTDGATTATTATVIVGGTTLTGEEEEEEEARTAIATMRGTGTAGGVARVVHGATSVTVVVDHLVRAHPYYAVHWGRS